MLLKQLESQQIISNVTFESTKKCLTQRNDLGSCSRPWHTIFLLLNFFSWASILLDLMTVASSRVLVLLLAFDASRELL
jgi:hypothetical protein